MEKSRFTEQQIVYALRHAESGVSVEEITRKTGISRVKVHKIGEVVGSAGGETDGPRCLAEDHKPPKRRHDVKFLKNQLQKVYFPVKNCQLKNREIKTFSGQTQPPSPPFNTIMYRLLSENASQKSLISDYFSSFENSGRQ